jgi:hypothetical protein
MASTILCSSYFLRAYLLTQMDETMNERDMAQALGYTFADGEDEMDALTMHIKACSVADLQRAAIIVMAESDRTIFYHDTIPLLMDTLVEVLDVPAKAITKAATKEVLADHAAERDALQAQIDAQKAPAAPPAAPAAKAKATPAKRKISADEASAFIAAAMQDHYADADAEDGADDVPNIASDTPAIGTKVRITDQRLHPKQQKYAGKEGTITGKVGDAWDVTFRGRSGGISSFMSDQISVVLA